jgi:hypothetical protein
MAFSALNCPAVSHMLSQIQADFGIEESLVAKYLGSPLDRSVAVVTTPAAPEKKKKRQIKEKSDGEQCTAMTTKGRCKFAAKCDGLCGIHLRKRDGETSTALTKPKEPKVVKKKKTEAPKHTHPLTEEDENCLVCETQGNVLNPEMTAAEFEAVTEDGRSIQERLAAILANSDEEDDANADDENAVLRLKLNKMISEEEGEEADIDQMCETPPSHGKLMNLMTRLSIEEESEEETNELEMNEY